MADATEKTGERVAKLKIRPPRDYEEVCKEIDRMRTLMRQYEERERARLSKVAVLEQQISDEMKETQPELDELVEELRARAKETYAYVDAHREELTKSGKYKSVIFPLEDIGRWTTSSYVDIPDEEAAIKELRKLRLGGKLIRTSTSINKDAIRKDPDLVKRAKTIAVRNRERFQFAFDGAENTLEAVVSDPKPDWQIMPPKAQRKS